MRLCKLSYFLYNTQNPFLNLISHIDSSSFDHPPLLLCCRSPVDAPWLCPPVACLQYSVFNRWGLNKLDDEWIFNSPILHWAKCWKSLFFPHYLVLVFTLKLKHVYLYPGQSVKVGIDVESLFQLMFSTFKVASLALCAHRYKTPLPCNNHTELWR